MDPSVLYWTGALANMALVVALAAVGVRFARRGEVARHRRAMIAAALLVLAFVVSYGVKLAVLGREQLELWSATDLWILRFHETCVALMLGGGAFALGRAWVLRSTRIVTGDPQDPSPRPGTLRWHRRAGWAALVGAVLGVASAGLVLEGMYARAADAPVAQARP